MPAPSLSNTENKKHRRRQIIVPPGAVHVCFLLTLAGLFFLGCLHSTDTHLAVQFAEAGAGCPAIQQPNLAQGLWIAPQSSTPLSQMAVQVLALSATPVQTKSHPHKVLKRSCQTCHVSESFKIIRFDHTTTDYPLEGRHESVPCLSCHVVENFTKVDQQCFSCHQDVHEAKLGPDCERCHTSQSWMIFDAEEIHERTRFPLLGRHILVDCETCHTGMPQNDFALNSASCESCHQQEYLAAQSPNHISSGFTTECESCHQMNSWRPAFLPDHDALFFPIFSGAHRGEWNDCSICHIDPMNNSVFSCFSCHEHNQQAMDSRHQGMAGYAYDSKTCLACHGSGEAGQFGEHDTQFFPIFSGSHTNQWDGCGDCHTDATNRKIFSCVTCHDHSQELMDPKHQGITGYLFNSADCYSCHPTGLASDFREHDTQFFPIFSGTHLNTWDECATCHTDAGNRQVFSCVTCHEHSQDLMDAPHQGIQGYVFNSANCLSCHPTGEQGDFLEHDAQFFPIFSGTHINTWDACATCHTDVNNRQVFSCVTCHEHAQDLMDPKHQGIQGYSFDSATCFGCHPTGEKGEFREHDSLYFPIYSGAHRGEWASCATCHNVPGNNKVFTCIDCHEHNQQRTDNQHLGEVQNYRYESAACYECHPRGRGER